MSVEEEFEELYDDETYVEEFDALYINLKATLPPEKYPAKQHAHSVAKHLGKEHGLIYLLGKPAIAEEDSDMDVPFRQRRYFYYLTGADFENCIATYDIGRDDLRLWIPPIIPRNVIWFGKTPSVDECKEKYDVDDVQTLDHLKSYLEKWLNRKHDKTIYVLHQNQSPRSVVEGSRFWPLIARLINFALLQPAMNAARVVKSDHEVGLIRRANQVTGLAHTAVLENIGKFSNEREIEAIFGATSVAKGAKKQSYSIIAASGENASVLHYIDNNEDLKGRQLVLLDAGAEWNCYASDITRTFPISGTYSKEAQEIYSIVQEMQEQCISRLKPGVVFREIDALARDICVKGLLKLGILHNGTYDEVYSSSFAFLPHRIGHHVGLEVHDIPGDPTNIATSGSLPCRRCWTSTSNVDRFNAENVTYRCFDDRRPLEPNMVITVEPGIYFTRYGMENLYLGGKFKKYINRELLERYYPVGGVRIEDNILITKDGYENISAAPKGEKALEIIRKHLPIASSATIPSKRSTLDTVRHLWS